MTSPELNVEAPPALPSSHRWDLDVLRIMAILGVISIHVFGLILIRTDLRGTATWTFGTILDLGSRWCVPMFVMISGALLLSPRAHQAGVVAFLRRRATRLLPALVVWHLVYLLLVRQVMLRAELVPDEVAVNFIDGRVFTALYFLWLILGLSVVAPALAAFIGGNDRRAKRSAVVGLAWGAALVALPLIATVLGHPRLRGENALTLWIPYVGVFIAGYAWRQPHATGSRWIWTGLTAVALIAVDIWLFSVAPDFAWLQAVTPPLEYPGLATALAAVALFVCVIDICARLRPSERVRHVLQILGGATFGVFLVHLVLVVAAMEWLPQLYASPAPLAKIELYVLVVVTAFAISIFAGRIPGLRRVF